MRFLLLNAACVSLLSAGVTIGQGPAKPKGDAAAAALRVELLRETLGEDSDFSLEGMPVPLGEKLRIAYACHGENELAKASLLYRVLPMNEPGKKPAEKEPWVVLPLAAVKDDEKSGPFNPKTGVFAKTKFPDQVPFIALPVSDPDKKQVRTLGGGRILLGTKGLIDSKGNPVQPRAGDRIEYCVEVT